jgi:cation transport regulator ChaB
LESRKSYCELYQSPADFKAKLPKSTQEAIKRAYTSAYLMYEKASKTGNSQTDKTKIPIFRSGIDMDKLRKEYLQICPQLDPDCLTDFYKSKAGTVFILLNELKFYNGQRLNPEYLKQQTAPNN